MAMQPTAPETNRPYPPPSNVTAVLQRLRTRNMPERVDIEYLRDANVPEGTLTRTMFALRFLGLVNEADEPTPQLRAIGTSTDEEYQGILSSLVREAYGEVFSSIDPAEDSQDRIINFFRRYTPASQRSRMVIFFLGMCREAGISTLDLPRQRAMAAIPRGAQPRQPREAEPPRRRRGGPSATVETLHPTLEGLIRSLPPIGTAFLQERRDQWLAMVAAALDYLYPADAGVTGDNSIENHNTETEAE